MFTERELLEADLVEAQRVYFHCEHQARQWSAPACEHWDEIVRLRTLISEAQ